MVERNYLKEISLISLSTLSLIGISFFAFSRELKEQVRKEQKNICASCGRRVKKLQIHHIIPASMGGKNDRSNAVGLCEDCHRYFDELALKKGIFFKR